MATSIPIEELPGLVERLRAIVSTLHSGGTLYEEDAQDISRAVKVIEAKFYGPAEEISELVERLNDEAMRLQGRGIDRGCVDSSLAGGLATEAADTLESLAAERSSDSDGSRVSGRDAPAARCEARQRGSEGHRP